MTNPLKFDDDGVMCFEYYGTLTNEFSRAGNHQPAKNIIAEISNSVGYQTRDFGSVRYMQGN